MSDLIDLLRDRADDCGGDKLLTDAADLLAEAQQAIEGLTADRNSWREQAGQRAGDWDAMRLERDALRVALVKIRREYVASDLDEERVRFGDFSHNSEIQSIKRDLIMIDAALKEPR